MSFYILAIYFWCAVAALGVAAPLVALAVQCVADAIASWLSSFDDEEGVISSGHGPVSCP